MEIQNVKGTHDIFLEEANAFNYVENLMKAVASLFGYGDVRPPVIEHSELFVRGVGESSDIVRKEMYTFLDKGERSLTLRPEFTAGIIRLLVQNKLLMNNELPFKAYYVGPVFRYERPQLGRYRQFNQFGVESVGNDNPINDLEVISLAYTILQTLGLENVTLRLNTLGDEESRNNYRLALKEYFKDHISSMCPDCQSRYELNPLRILDCKVPEDHKIVEGAPKMSNFLSANSKERFNFIINALKEMNIPYEIDDTLVRGLDYYSETVFEFHYTSSNGNNYGAIGAGGHYDKLVKEVGGPELPGIGFSFGVERIVSVLKDDGLLSSDVKSHVNFYVMPMSKNEQLYALKVANSVRMLGYSADICFDEVKMGSQFKRASKKGALYAIIIGEDEKKNNTFVVKDLQSQTQNVIHYENIENELIQLLEGESECQCGHHHHDEEDHCCCHEDGCCCGHHKGE